MAQGAEVDAARPDPRQVLTPRETEVLALTARGLRNQDVAEALSVSIHAVRFHLAAIYRKLGVANRTEAAARYLVPALDDHRERP